MLETLKKNRVRLAVLAVLAVLLITAMQGMDTEDWVITVLRGLSVGALTFLVAAGLSLILGLMDVLNLAHGETFMLGAYVGWTVFVRPDTFVDLLTPVLLLSVGFVLLPLWRALLAGLIVPRWLPWLSAILGLLILAVTLLRFPIAIWNLDVYTESPVTYSLAADQGNLVLPEPPDFTAVSPIVAIVGTLLGGCLLALAGAGWQRSVMLNRRVGKRPIILAAVVLFVALLTYFANDALTNWLFTMNSTWRFLAAMAVASLVGFVLGGLIEVALIRPLYDRPIYQLMITLGLSFMGIEIVRDIWGQPGFTMPKAALFTGSGDGCPATSIGDWLTYHCTTMILFDGRIRTYNELFVIFVGLVVLVAVWLLLKQTRIGMIIRAGVQDREMVEALGINVRQVFTFVFALGVGLASLGGVLAGPSIGLSPDMGTRLLLLALIALAIGGLTSFPGAAAGAVLVGLLQQFIIKYGQIGINLPFLAEPFKPTPPLVPASTVLLMVIILLILPNGLFGRSES